MSCVWNGILQAIKDDYTTCEDNVLKTKILSLTNYSLLKLIKHNNKCTHDVKWCGNYLSPKQYTEHHTHIETLDDSYIPNGYECGTCEPLLFMVSNMFKVDIIHTYNNNVIIYTYTGDESRLKYVFGSNSGHFWFTKIEPRYRHK
jgi:hypothetical protein